MRHAYWIALAVLVAIGPPTVAADNSTDLDREASRVDAATSGQGHAQVAARTADELNAQWAPNPPAFPSDSVRQQRGPEKLGGWGGVLIGNLIAVNVAKSLLAAPSNTLTPEQALALARQEVMEARRGPDQKGWGRIAQDLTGQKLGSLTKDVRPAVAAVTGQPPNP